MRFKTLSVRAAILASLCSMRWAQVCEAGSYHSTACGYTLSIPDDWKQIPDSDLQRTMGAVANPNAPHPYSFDAGFQQASDERSLTYPYLIVQILPYSNFGSGGQINEDQFPEVIKALTGANLKKAVDSQISPQAKSLIGGSSLGDPTLDTPNRRYIVPITMTVAGLGPVHGELAGFFGKDSLVQVMYYCKAADWDQYSPMMKTIANSFQFDPDRAYSVAEAAAHPSRSMFDWGQTGNAAVRGAVIGGVAGLLIYGLKKLKRN